jgi:gluconate kinase
MKKGVIFVAGLIGTGKTSLAKGLAEKLNIPYLDVDKVKKEVYPTDPNYEYNLKNNIPFSDEIRIKTFNRVVEEIAKLSKTHSYIVVDETLHKKALREILFDGAKKYFGDYLLVSVKTDETIIKERLESNVREGHIITDAFGMYLSLKKVFDEFESPDVVFENNGSIDEGVEKLAKLVQEKINV